MEVYQLTSQSCWPHSVIFKSGQYAGSSWSKELETAELATLNSEQFHCAFSAGRCRNRTHAADVPARPPRSRSSPDRRSSGPSHQRTRSPSTAALPTTTVPTAPIVLSPLLYYDSNTLGAAAFYSLLPPAAPMYVVPLPPNPAPRNGTNTLAHNEQQTKTKEKKSQKSKNKESKKVVRYVMQTVLRAVHTAVTCRTAPPHQVPFVSIDGAEGISPPKASPLYHSVASQTRPKSSFNRHTADADSDDLSISSEERCVEYEESCEWVGDVRALRASHLRLALRQLRQLRHIERLDRSLHRAHVYARTQSATASHPASSTIHTACL